MRDIIAEELGLEPMINYGDKSNHRGDLIDYKIIDDKDSKDIDTVKDDVEVAREAIKTMVEEGTDALKELFSVAKSSESPKAYEAASALMKSIIEASKGLIDASKEKRQVILQENGGNQQPTNVTNNNTVVMTTGEFLQMIRDKKKAKEDGKE